MSDQLPEATAPRLLTETETARYIGFSVHTLRAARCNGNLPGRAVMPPHVQVGRSIRYRLEDLDAWLNGLGGRKAI